MRRPGNVLLVGIAALIPVPVPTPSAPEEAPAEEAPAPAVVVIEGKGHGHGVGMAQDGAYWMGKAGASVDTILNTFYPGTARARRSGMVRVGLVQSPAPSYVVSLPGGGEVVEAGPGGTSPGFPVSVKPGGSVRLAFEGGRYHAFPLDGATAAPIAPPRPPSPAPAAPATPPADTTTTTALLGLIPLPPPPTTVPATTVPPPPPPAAPSPSEPTSERSLWAVPKEGSSVAVPDLQARYRGKIQATAEGAGLQLVNELDVEQYLRGMGEVRDPGWPAAALQAQAIAARTYALDAMADGSGLCSTQQCQVYLGETAEYAAMDKAVADTKGQVLTFRGSLAETVYSANAGGVSATPEEGFGNSEVDYPYLRSVVYTTGDPGAWDMRLDAAALGSRTGYPGRATDARVSRSGPSGRVLEVTLAGDAGDHVVAGRDFADALQLRSNLFTLRTEVAAALEPEEAVPASVGVGTGTGPWARGYAYRLGGGGQPEGLGRPPWAALALLLLVAATTGIHAVRRPGGPERAAVSPGE